LVLLLLGGAPLLLTKSVGSCLNHYRSTEGQKEGVETNEEKGPVKESKGDPPLIPPGNEGEERFGSVECRTPRAGEGGENWTTQGRGENPNGTRMVKTRNCDAEMQPKETFSNTSDLHTPKKKTKRKTPRGKEKIGGVALLRKGKGRTSAEIEKPGNVLLPPEATPKNEEKARSHRRIREERGVRKENLLYKK